MCVYKKAQRSGQSAILLVLMIAMATMALIAAFMPATQFGYKALQKENAGNFKAFAASMAATSAIPAMVAALERRWWTPPLDTNCLAKDYFTLDIQMAGGIRTNVTAYYSQAEETFQMISRAWFAGDSEARVAYMQTYKVINAATMMFVSTSPRPIAINSGGSTGSVGALIAGSRRLYFSGPLELCSRTDWNTPHHIRSAKNNFEPGTRDITQLFATIIQADRIYAMGGLGYMHRGSQQPNPNGAPYDIITDYWRDNHANYYGESCGGGAMITKDFSFANKARQMVESGNKSLFTPADLNTPEGKATFYKQVYPKALFAKTNPAVPGPMKASDGVDTGAFMGSPENWLWFGMSYGGANGFGNHLDLTCLQSAGPATPTDPKKTCSKNTDWPAGFAAWRSQAGLTGTLLTNTDNETIRFPKLTWDNLEALREDAQQCGVIVSPSNHDGSFEDCNIASTQLWERYRNNPDQNPCTTVRKLNIDQIIDNVGPGPRLNNYNPAAYTDPNLAKKLVRRVIYSTEDLELSQTHINGLMPTITNVDHRKRMLLWVVNEKTTKLRTYQKMTLDNGQEDPGTIANPSFKRTVYFNESPNGIQPLPMVMLSPDPVEILSPQFVSVVYDSQMPVANLLDDFPVTTDRFIKPKVHLATYARLHEDDGYKWGARNINISNVAFLTGAGRPGAYADPNLQLFARGMWASPNDPGGRMEISNACMMDQAGDGWARRAGDGDFYENPLPASLSWGMIADPNLHSVGLAQPTADEIAFGTPSNPSRLAQRGSQYWLNAQAPECLNVGVATGSTHDNRIGCTPREWAGPLTPSGLQPNIEVEDGVNLPPRGSRFYTNWSSPQCQRYELPIDGSNNAGAVPGSRPENRLGCTTWAGFPSVFTMQSSGSQINLKGLRMFLTFEDCSQGSPNCYRPSGKRQLDQSLLTYSDTRGFRHSPTSQDGAWAPFDLTDKRFIWPYNFYWSTAGDPASRNSDHPRARCMPSQLGTVATPGSTGVGLGTYVNKNAESIVQIVPGDDLNNLGAIGTLPAIALQTVSGRLPTGSLVDGPGGSNNGDGPTDEEPTGGIDQWLNPAGNDYLLKDHQRGESEVPGKDKKNRGGARQDETQVKSQNKTESL
jgi:hypothetical protein